MKKVLVLLAACMVFATEAWAQGRRHAIELTAGSSVRAGCAGQTSALLAYAPGVDLSATVNVVRVRMVYEPEVTTNANVETEYRVTWISGAGTTNAVTNSTAFAERANAAGRYSVLAADTNLTVSFATNYTTNVYAIVTNQVARDVRLFTNNYMGGGPVYVLPNDLLELVPTGKSNAWVNLVIQE